MTEQEARALLEEADQVRPGETRWDQVGPGGSRWDQVGPGGTHLPSSDVPGGPGGVPRLR